MKIECMYLKLLQLLLLVAFTCKFLSVNKDAREYCSKTVVLNWGYASPVVSMNFQRCTSLYALYNMKSFWTGKYSVKFTSLKTGVLKQWTI